MPGNSEIQGLDWMNETLAFRSQPQLGVGGCVPRPRNESVASTMIEVAMTSVVVTMIGARQFGRIVAQQDPRIAYADGAARLDVLLLLDRGARLPRTSRA